MVTEKQKREQTGLGQDQPSGQTSITDPAGTVPVLQAGAVPVLWAGMVLSGNQRQSSLWISNLEFQAGLGHDADCIQINIFSFAEKVSGKNQLPALQVLSRCNF